MLPCWCSHVDAASEMLNEFFVSFCVSTERIVGNWTHSRARGSGATSLAGHTTGSLRGKDRNTHTHTSAGWIYKTQIAFSYGFTLSLFLRERRRHIEIVTKKQNENGKREREKTERHGEREVGREGYHGTSNSIVSSGTGLSLKHNTETEAVRSAAWRRTEGSHHHNYGSSAPKHVKQIPLWVCFDLFTCLNYIAK